jgi:hypothetical protein
MAEGIGRFGICNSFEFFGAEVTDVNSLGGGRVFREHGRFLTVRHGFADELVYGVQAVFRL